MRVDSLIQLLTGISFYLILTQLLIYQLLLLKVLLPSLVSSDLASDLSMVSDVFVARVSSVF